MTEIFYDISHLTTPQLQDLFTSYRNSGWVDYEYYELKEDNLPIRELSDADIILNIQAGNEGNYCVFMLDHENEKDGVMIGFGLTYHEDYAAYLHLPSKMLDELILKYHLINTKEAKDYTINEFLIEGRQKNSLN